MCSDILDLCKLRNIKTIPMVQSYLQNVNFPFSLAMTRTFLILALKIKYLVNVPELLFFSGLRYCSVVLLKSS